MRQLWMELAPPNPRMGEAAFQKEVLQIAGYYGFKRTHHEKFSVGTKPGYPDLTLVNPIRGGVVWFEIKGGTGKSVISQSQKDWITDLQCAGQHAYIVYPRDMDLVQKILRGDYPAPEVESGFAHSDLWVLQDYQV